MRTPAYLCLLLTCMLISCTPTQEKHEIDYTSYVNPFIGTDFTGNTYPGAQAPFGMVQLSPDNGLPGWDRISGYFYPDSTIAGFSHTHLSGTGAGDLYDISFMPVTLPYKEAEAPLGIHSKFSHKDESAHAGYYQVRLTDYNINVELTATERCGIQRYTFPEAQSAIFLNLKKAMNWDFTNDSHIEVVDSVTIQGYRFSDGWARDQHIYFRTRFSKPFEKMELDTTAIIKDNKRIGTAVIARFDFNTQKDEQILVNTAVSGVSMEGAAKNLQAEVPENNFDKYLAETKANWNRQLGKIEIKGDNENDKVNFYQIFPCPADRFFLEVIAERPVTKHFKHGVVVRIVSYFFQVIMLSAYTQTFLRVRDSLVFRRMVTQNNIFKLVHTRVRKHQGRVIFNHHRSRGNDVVSFRLKEILE